MLIAYLKVIQREVKRFYKRPLIWNIGFIMPMIMSLLVCWTFSQGSPKNLPVAVLDQDNSAISRMIVRDFNTLPSCSVNYQVTDMRQGEKLLAQSKIYAFLVIPRHFEKDLYSLKQPKLAFYYNNQKILIGAVISKDVSTMVQTLMVGIDAKMRSKKGLPMKEAIKQANLINVVDHVRSNPYFNYQYFLALIVIGHIVQIHMVLTSIWALGSEFKLGTAKMWLKMADDNILIAFLGKMTPYFLLFLVLFVNLFTTYYSFSGAPFEGSWLFGVLATMLFICAALSVATFYVSINGNMRFALSAAAFYVAMGFSFSGVTYPVMAMPEIAKIFSASMPLTYWIKVMIDQSIRLIPPIYDLKYILSLLAIMTLGFMVLPRIKTLAKDETRWYKS